MPKHLSEHNQQHLTAKSPLISRRKRSSSNVLKKERTTSMGYGSTASPSEGLGSPGKDYSALDDQTSGKDWFLESPAETVMLISVILNAMAAGIIFIFSNTIMPTLATCDPEVGIFVMNTINTIIVNPLFAFIFFGGLISAYPTGVMWKRSDEFSAPARYYALASTLIYFFGQFLVTLTQNVPRNDSLQAVDVQAEDGINYWTEEYLKSWVAWNTARGIFALVSSILGAMSLVLMRKS
mmetsp:Transcript_16794/g.27928  ORF Transcript_16794/g.27928 Transcript_16794/m.27928 type:complete len:238 (-) Transcript_16794:254-967(-)